MSELSDKYVVLERWEVGGFNDKYRLAVEKISEFGEKLDKQRGLLMRALQQLEYHQENFDIRCSHSVGICFCELREVIKDIKEALGNEQNNQSC